MRQMRMTCFMMVLLCTMSIGASFFTTQPAASPGYTADLLATAKYQGSLFSVEGQQHDQLYRIDGNGELTRYTFRTLKMGSQRGYLNRWHIRHEHYWLMIIDHNIPHPTRYMLYRIPLAVFPLFTVERRARLYEEINKTPRPTEQERRQLLEQLNMLHSGSRYELPGINKVFQEIANHVWRRTPGIHTMHDLYQIYRNLHYDFLPVSETELLLYVQHGTTLTEWRLTCIRDPREDRDTFYWDAKKVREYDSPLREPFHVIHSRDTTYLCSRSGDIHLFQDDQIVTVHRNENEAAYLLYRDLDTDSCYVIGREYYFRIAREITKQRFAGSSMAILRGLLPLTLENATP